MFSGAPGDSGRRAGVLAAACLYAWAGPAAAAAGPAPPAGSGLSLDTAIGRSLEHNYEYLSLLNNVALADLDLEDVRSNFRTRFFMNVDSQARIGSELGSNFRTGMGRKLESGSRWQVQFYNSDFSGNNLSELQFSYSLPFFSDPLQSGVLELRRAELDLQHRQRLVQVGAEELIMQVITDYYGAVLGRSAVAAAEGETGLAGSLLEATRIRARTGHSSPLDSRAAQLRVAQARQRWNTARAASLQADNRLRRTLGMGVDEPLELTSSLPPVAETQPAPADPEDLERRALAHRAELLRLGEELDLARRKLRTEPASRLPGFDVVLQFSRVGQGATLSDSMSLDENRIGVGVSMDIDVDGRRDQVYRRLTLFYREKQRAYDRLEQDVRAEVRAAVIDLQDKAGALALARDGVDLAEQRFRLAELRYRGGSSSTEEILEREQALSEARQQERTARAAYLVASREIDRVTGTLADRWQP